MLSYKNYHIAIMPHPKSEARWRVSRSTWINSCILVQQGTEKRQTFFSQKASGNLFRNSDFALREDVKIHVCTNTCMNLFWRSSIWAFLFSVVFMSLWYDLGNFFKAFQRFWSVAGGCLHTWLAPNIAIIGHSERDPSRTLQNVWESRATLWISHDLAVFGDGHVPRHP